MSWQGWSLDSGWDGGPQRCRFASGTERFGALTSGPSCLWGGGSNLVPALPAGFAVGSFRLLPLDACKRARATPAAGRRRLSVRVAGKVPTFEEMGSTWAFPHSPSHLVL